MGWQSSMLSIGYIRKIVGFDIRVSPSEHGLNRNDVPYLGNWYDEMAVRLTIDPLIWPSTIKYNDPAIHSSGVNLLIAHPSAPPNPSAPPKLSGGTPIVVAFDLPSALITELSSTFGLVEQAIEVVSRDVRFHFCGFDIVDIRTTSSFFYSFNWQTAEIMEILNKHNLRLNSWGIIDSETDAIKASIAFDKIIPEHAPFAPCGVWLCPAP